jgi:hypothetical protein
MFTQGLVTPSLLIASRGRDILALLIETQLSRTLLALEKNMRPREGEAASRSHSQGKMENWAFL